MASESSDSKHAQDQPYVLGRDYTASGRLAMLHLLIHAQLGYLIHPTISEGLPEDKSKLRVADVGTGTGIWIAELTRELPPTAQLDGFDISDEQFPPTPWYGENVSLSKLDIFKPLPEQLKGKYDVVHLRYFMTVAKDENVQIVVDNLKAMLKPGGYLQWVERDWLSHFPDPEHVKPTDDANTRLTGWLKTIWSNTNWITNLPTYFSASDLTVLANEAHSLLPIYRKAWNDDNLIGTYAAVDRIKDEEERKRVKEIHAEAAAEAANGWWVDWKLIICAGKKKGR